jgi:hypothetical protein
MPDGGSFWTIGILTGGALILGQSPADIIGSMFASYLPTKDPSPAAELAAATASPWIPNRLSLSGPRSAGTRRPVRPPPRRHRSRLLLPRQVTFPVNASVDTGDDVHGTAVVTDPCARRGLRHGCRHGLARRGFSVR